MTTKATNIIYWITTVIFSMLMIFTTLNGFKPSDDAIKLIHTQLGFPVYFIPFISVAKMLGSIVILIPGINRSIKDWAYAGLFFDIASAIYGGIVTSVSFDPKIFGMLILDMFNMTILKLTLIYHLYLTF